MSGCWLRARTRDIRTRDGGGKDDPVLLVPAGKCVWFRNLDPDRLRNDRDLEVVQSRKPPTKKELDAQDLEQERRIDAEQAAREARRKGPPSPLPGDAPPPPEDLESEEDDDAGKTGGKDPLGSDDDEDGDGDEGMPKLNDTID